MSVMHKPLHPGEIVKEALLEGTHLTVTEAARYLQVDRSTLSRLLNGHAGISVDMAHRLALFLETSPDMWLNLQKDYELWQLKQNTTIKITPLRELKRKR